MKADWIDAGGVALRYELAGDHGPLVVLLHEMGGTLDSWDAVVPHLARDYRVLRYDARGAGLSEKMRGTASGTQLADDLAALLDALVLGGRATLVGTAVGANVALRFAARYPARTGALVLSSPATGIPPERRTGLLDTIGKFEREGMRAVEAASLASSYPEAIRTEDPVRFARTRARWLANDPESLAATYRMLVETDIASVLAAVTAPVLLIGCTLDPVRPPDGVRALADQIAGARFVTVESGHFLAIQHPDALLDVLLPFLQEQRIFLEG